MLVVLSLVGYYTHTNANVQRETNCLGTTVLKRNTLAHKHTNLATGISPLILSVVLILPVVPVPVPNTFEGAVASHCHCGTLLESKRPRIIQLTPADSSC